MARPQRRHRRALRLAAAVLPRAVPDRRQVLGLRDGRHPRARTSSRSPTARSRSTLKYSNYVALTDRQPVLARLPREPEVRARARRCCACSSATRSPTSWRAPGRSLQPTLLMLVMLPFWTSFLLRVYAWKGAARRRRLGRQTADRGCTWTRCCCAGRPDRGAGPADAHHVLADRGHDLHLPAVHDPAAVRQPVEDGPAPARGRVRPRRHALGRVLARDGAAVLRRHHRRLDARLHPLRRRVRDARAARRPARR